MIALLLLLPCLVAAQADTLFLPEVEINALRLRSTPVGAGNIHWDSTALVAHTTDHIGGLLSKGSLVFLKSYGAGSLATSSIRGGGAGHTAVVWNGLPLQSPMLGLLDLSLLPVVFADEATLSYGGNSALWGSGAIGGVVALENKTLPVKGLRAQWQSSTGSFGWQNHQGVLRYGNGRLGGSTRFFYQQAKNDFPFIPAPGLPERKQQHAAIRQAGVLQEAFWNIHPAQQLTLRIWAQNSDRELPPTLVQTRSEATQADESLRTALHWNRNGKRSTLQARAAFFSDKIDYRDAQYGTVAISRFHTWFAEADGQWRLDKNRVLQGGITESLTRAFSENYEKPPSQNRTAAFASLRQHWGGLRLQMDARQELSDGKLTPFIPSVGAEFTPGNYLVLKARIVRNYRLPTLNDLHWQPGGNPNLLPEQGWSQELGSAWKSESKHFSTTYTFTVFHRNLKDWMLWSLRDGQPFYSVSNIAEVRSRGMEQRLHLTWHRKDWIFWADLAYDFIRSTNERAISSPQIAKGEQLWYTPLHQASGEAGLRWNGLECSYRHHLTSSVTTLSEPLPGYRLGSFRFQFSKQGKRFGGRLFLEVENVWDARYQVIERRAMPGRAWRVGFSGNVQ